MAVYTDEGTEVVSELTRNSTTTATWHIGWGSGSATLAITATTNDTASATENRVVATATGTAATDTTTWVGTLVATATRSGIGSGALYAGGTTASGTGEMVIQGGFAPIALNTGDQIEFTITLQQT